MNTISIVSGCGGIMNADVDGELTSPGWPGVYEHLSNCSWLIQATNAGN